MRVFQPADDLGVILLPAATHNLSVCLKDLSPELQIALRRLFRTKIGAPPIRESLQAGTFSRRQPAHNVVRVFDNDGRIFIVGSHQGVDKILLRGQVERALVRLWNEIFQIVKENCSTDYSEPSPQDDLMERLLRARKG